jgi:hypothetical protein
MYVPILEFHEIINEDLENFNKDINISNEQIKTISYLEDVKEFLNEFIMNYRK